jgi:hypothetical protein
MAELALKGCGSITCNILSSSRENRYKPGRQARFRRVLKNKAGIQGHPPETILL